LSKKTFDQLTNRRKFISMTGVGVASLVVGPHIAIASVGQPLIQRSEKAPDDQDASKGWISISDRKIRIGIVGYGYSKFGAAFGFQNHPNVEVKVLPNLSRPSLPPGVEAGGHGGSQGRLMDEFITSILQYRKPLVDIATALNMTVGDIVAHQSALKDGELMKIPQYKF
jgi:hypothetical protein